jgi:tRNA threonylcarbamoyladenosine biosynthesis protein TsaE
LGESQFPGPGLHLRNQLVAIELSAIDRHAPIVKTLRWPDEAATQRFAESLAASPDVAHAFIALHGDLGAGKTTLVRHLLHALGVTGRIKSPTYAVVEPYELPALNIWHFDFYRFADPREWEDAGFRDIFASAGLKLAEWPEKAGAMLPCADLDITIVTTPDTARHVSLSANTPTGVALLHAAHTEGPQP